MTEPQTNDSVWNYKPWWCQPWSIVLTGITGISGSWFLLHYVWVTAIISALVLAWWTLFLVIYPKEIAESGLLEDLASNPASEKTRPN